MSDVDPGAYIRQLTGAPIARHAGLPRCTTCGTFLAENAQLTAYAYRFSDEPTLSVARVYCEVCDRTTVRHPTLGAEEVVVAASLAKCHGRLVLSSIEVCDWTRKKHGNNL